MCGICGKFIFDNEASVDPELIDGMTTLLHHRGPDDAGHYISGPIGLGQRRLGIIDRAGGNQPISNAEDTIWIVFNGEIYNHGELRVQLEAQGYPYKTRTDTETILHAYEAWGTNCVEKLRGMFAFAIWDCRDRSLFLARDRFGMKPLYYWQDSEQFSFASEMKALWLDPTLDSGLDAVALYDYFTFGFIPGVQTPFTKIRRLPPAHWMRIQNGETKIQRYWQPQIERRTSHSWNGCLEELESLLNVTISDHLMSEAPQGLFLSGGVDSTLMALLMSQKLQEPLRTFAIAFPGQPGFDESSYARQAADHCQAQHHVFDCTDESIDNLDEILWHVEEPLADPAMLPLHSLCKAAAEHVTVVHCGDGGDEAFGGYSRFFWDRYAGAYGRLPNAVRQCVLAPIFRGLQAFPGALKEVGRRGEKFSRHAGLPDFERYMNWFAQSDDSRKHEMLSEDLLVEVGKYRSSDVFRELFSNARGLGLDQLGAMQYTELHSYIPDNLMQKSDKIAMAASLEGRFPFLDHRLVEFGLALPSNFKISGKTMKRPLKALLARHLPRDFVYRRKQGFEVPVIEWLRTTLKAPLAELIADQKRANTGILKTDYFEELGDRLKQGDPAVGKPLYSAFIFLRWAQIFAHPHQRALDALAARRAVAGRQAVLESSPRR